MRRFIALSLLITPVGLQANPLSIDELVAMSHGSYSVSALVVAGICAGVLATLMTKHPFVRWIFLFIGMGISAACFAPVIAVPNSFSNGEPADANQVNANFDDVVTQIANHVDDENVHSNDPAQGIVTLEPDGSVSIKTPGSSTGIYIRPNGNIEIVGNTVSIDAGSSAKINAGVDAVINAANEISATAGTQTNLTSGGSITMQGASSIETFAGSTTNINSGGAISLQGAVIDLN